MDLYSLFKIEENVNMGIFYQGPEVQCLLNVKDELNLQSLPNNLLQSFFIA